MIAIPDGAAELSKHVKVGRLTSTRGPRWSGGKRGCESLRQESSAKPFEGDGDSQNDTATAHGCFARLYRQVV